MNNNLGEAVNTLVNALTSEVRENLYEKRDEILNETSLSEALSEMGESFETSDEIDISEDARRPLADDRDNKIRDIHIKEVHRGYIVDIGCHKFAISTGDELIKKLGEYVKSPSKTEEKWFKGELF